MAALTLKQIERGSYAYIAADATVTITLATPLTDTTKTILLFSVRTSQSSPGNFLWIGRVLSTTQIQFERQNTAGTGILEYQVIEFTQGITVQHLYFSQTAGTIDTTITAVTLSKAFVIVTVHGATVTWGQRHMVKADLSSTTNLQTIMSSFLGPPVIAAQVVEIDDASVQKITDTFGTGSTKDITVTTITENKTFWFFSNSAPSSMTNDNIPYLSYVNSTTLRFTRVSAAGIDFPFVAFVVSLSSGIIVQNISTVIASSANNVVATIPNAVIVADTAMNTNSFYQRMASVNEVDDNAGNSSFTLSALTTNAFTATRFNSPALSATTNVQVMEFYAGVSGSLTGDSVLVGGSPLTSDSDLIS